MAIADYSWTSGINTVIDFMRTKNGRLNPSLIFNKYIFWDETGERTPTLNKKNEDNSISKNYHKIKHFENVINCELPLTSTQYNYLKNRKNTIPYKRLFNLTTKTKLIVNHGVKSILENSISLHPYYGFPVIPGSAIKGVTRHYCEEFENLKKEEIIKIFGNYPRDNKTAEGTIIFLDAWPSIEHLSKNGKKLKLNSFYEVDVFTPHYQEYYKQNGFPSDDQDPLPFNFLAVKNNVKFEFVIASNSKFNRQRVQKDLECTEELICKALRNIGIGAKTGSSYGYFD